MGTALDRYMAETNSIFAQNTICALLFNNAGFTLPSFCKQAILIYLS